MRFSEKLQSLRKESKMSQEQLADMLDVSRQSVSKWESGQTYPEMDKLLSMCKIFKCSLDDLTNDDITSIKPIEKSKSNVGGIINEMLDLINRSYDMFKKMHFSDFVKMFLEMFILFIIILIFHYPFEYIYELVGSVFNNFGDDVSRIFNSIFYLIINCAYFILGVVVFFYIYKIKYLDKYANIKISDVKDIMPEETVKEPKKEIVIERDPKGYQLFLSIGSIAILLIKFFVVCMTVPFMMSLIGLSGAFIVSMILLFKGVLYLGIILGIICLIVLNVLFLIIVGKLVFSKKLNFKLSLITFIASIVGLGIAGGIATIEISNTVFIPTAPTSEEKTVFEGTYKMNEELFVHDTIGEARYSYVVDETQGDNVKIVLEYYKDYNNMELYLYDNTIGVKEINTETISIKKLFDLVIEDLSNKRLYNYTELYRGQITIYASQKSIDILKQNRINYYEETNRIEENNQYDYYENRIEELEIEMSRLNNENEELTNKVNDYETKINDYMNVLSGLLED